MSKQGIKARNHVVPRFYLARFSAGDKYKTVTTFDMETDEVRQLPADDTGIRIHAYTMRRADGTRSDILENMFEEIETAASRLFSKLEVVGDLRGEEREIFSNFLALMMCRTQSHRREYAAVKMAEEQHRHRLIAQDDEKFGNWVRGKENLLNRKMSRAERDAARTFMLSPDRFAVSVSNPWTLRAMTLADQATAIFHRMNWTILLPESGSYFITGDTPIVRELPPNKRGSSQRALCNPDIRVTMPMGPQFCLLATWEKDAPRHLDRPGEIVRHLNYLRGVYATKELYGPRDDDEIRAIARRCKDIQPRVYVGDSGPDEFSPIEVRRGE